MNTHSNQNALAAETINDGLVPNVTQKINGALGFFYLTEFIQLLYTLTLLSSNVASVSLFYLKLFFDSQGLPDFNNKELTDISIALIASSLIVLWVILKFKSIRLLRDVNNPTVPKEVLKNYFKVFLLETISLPMVTLLIPIYALNFKMDTGATIIALILNVIFKLAWRHYFKTSTRVQNTYGALA